MIIAITIIIADIDDCADAYDCACVSKEINNFLFRYDWYHYYYVLVSAVVSLVPCGTYSNHCKILIFFFCFIQILIK